MQRNTRRSLWWGQGAEWALGCWESQVLFREALPGEPLTAFFVGSDVLWLSCRAQSYAERLRLGLAVIHGEAQCTEQDMDDGRHSPPMVKNATVHPGLELPCKIKLLCSSLSKKDEWEMAPGGAL